MAKGKKSFVLYSDYQELFSELSDADAGKLIKHIFAYVNDENPICEEQIINISFIPIKLQLKRDLKKFEEIKEKRSEIGRIGGLKSAEQRTKTKQNEPNEAIASFAQANQAVNDNVTVTVNDTVKKNNIEERKLKFADTLKPFIEKYGKPMLRDFYLYWTEPNKSGTKFKQEMLKTWDVSRRLETWSRNDFNKTKPEKKEEIQQTIKLGDR